MWTTLRVSDRDPYGTAFVQSGTQNAPAVILIHGLGLSQEIWDDHRDAFNEYRVISYDLYGHGGSAPAPRVADLALFAEQIAGLMDHLAIKTAHIVGFSIGGMINRRFAMDFPDRVLSLVILNSPHDRGEDAQALVEARAKSVRDQGAFSTFDEALKRWFTPQYLARGDGPARVRQWREEVDGESYAQTAWVLANGVVELIRPDPPVQARTLVMTCENDSGSTPKMAHDIAAEIDGAQCQIIPLLQHLGLMENPSIFDAAIVAHLKEDM